MRDLRAPFIAITIVLSSMVARQAIGEDSPRQDSQAANQAREHASQARVHYQLGRFEQALEEYAAAYELDPVPALLYNMGQCHRQLDNFERAIFFYEGYLRGSPDARNRSLVEDLIIECRAALERQSAEPESSTQSDDGSTGDDTSSLDEQLDDRSDPDDPANAALDLDQPVVEGRRPIYRRWWFWTIIGSVVAASAGLTIWALLRDPDVPQGSLGTVDWR